MGGGAKEEAEDTGACPPERGGGWRLARRFGAAAEEVQQAQACNAEAADTQPLAARQPLARSHDAAVDGEHGRSFPGPLSRRHAATARDTVARGGLAAVFR